MRERSESACVDQHSGDRSSALSGTIPIAGIPEVANQHDPALNLISVVAEVLRYPCTVRSETDPKQSNR